MPRFFGQGMIGFWVATVLSLSFSALVSGADLHTNVDGNVTSSGDVNLGGTDTWTINFTTDNSELTFPNTDTLTTASGSSTTIELVGTGSGTFLLDGTLTHSGGLLTITGDEDNIFSVGDAGSGGAISNGGGAINVDGLELLFNGTNNSSNTVSQMNFMDADMIVGSGNSVPAVSGGINFYFGELIMQSTATFSQNVTAKQLPPEATSETGVIDVNDTGMILNAASGADATYNGEIQYDANLNFRDSRGDAWGKSTLLRGSGTLSVGATTFTNTDSLALAGEFDDATGNFQAATLAIDNLDKLQNTTGTTYTGGSKSINLGFSGGVLDLTPAGAGTFDLTGHRIKTMTFQDVGLGTYPAKGTIKAGNGGDTLQLAQNKMDLSDGMLEVLSGAGTLTLDIDCGGAAGIDTSRLGGLDLGPSVELSLTNVSGTELGVGNIEGSGSIDLTGKTAKVGSDVGQSSGAFEGSLTANSLKKVGNAETTIGSGATITVSQVDVEQGTLKLDGATVSPADLNLTGGTLAVTNNGTLAVANDSTITGGTVTTSGGGEIDINGGTGTLTVGQNATLMGELLTGNLIIGDGGTLAPGNSIDIHTTAGTLTLNSGSTTKFELNPLASGTTVGIPGIDNDAEVAQQVDIKTGASVVVVKNADYSGSDSFKEGDKYYVMAAEAFDSGNGGILNKSGLSVSSGITGMAVDSWDVETHDLSAHAGNANSEWLWITLKENPMIEPSSPNGKAVYQYLQNLSGSGQMGTLVAAINGLTPSEQSKAMEMITGESIGTQTSCGLQHSTLAGMSLNSQIRGAGLSGTGGGAPGGFAANETDDGTIMLGQSLYIPVWHGWVAGYGMGGTIFADENTSKTGVSVGGVLFGVERMIDYTCKAGFFYSYGHAHNSVAELGSYVKSDDHLFGGYLSHDSDVFYCTLLGGIGYDDYHSARHNVIGAIDEWAYGTHTGWQSLESTEIGMRLETGLVTWEPYFTLQHAYIWQNAYTENTTLAPNTANSFSGFGMHSLRDLLGLRVRRMFYCWGHQSEWEFRSTWVHELLDQAAPIYSTQLAGASGNSSLVADGANLGRDWALLGAGTKWHLSSQIELFADYELFFNARQTLHTGMGGMAMSW